MTRWTLDQYQEHQARQTKPGLPPRAVAASKPARHALGRLPVGAMNKTEARYAEHLTTLQRAGEILWFMFEGIKFRLADNTFYTPDFEVMAADGVMEIHEVKGFWEDDARVKIKVAAALFPFRFKAFKPITQKNGGGWSEEAF